MSAVNKSTTQTRNAYLSHCVRISLLRRWLWLVAAAVLGVVIGVAFDLSLGFTAALAVGLLLILGLAIGLNSWQRHSDDFEAQSNLR
ncbi:hypothetical protein Dxin01_04197 [Deinococcus xinjiangensis]|uniref:Uncharacterized protein n=1 Tax=Deinococcus xinjiangensis TaxID=457454 RepID=A0ABP9VL70_9DEIO